MRVIHDNFIVSLPTDLSQNNNHGDFSVESPNDGHLRVIMKQMKEIAFQFAVVTVTVV